MAHKLNAIMHSDPEKKILAVVGAGHVPGILKHFENVPDLSALETLPPRSVWPRIIAWSIPAIIVGMILYGFLSAGFSVGREMIVAWATTTAFFAGIGAAFSLPHPLTVLAGAISAPITTLPPFLAAGWVAGLVEALINKPRVSDLENVGDDLLSLRSIWTNRLTKILLVIAFTNLGSTIGIAVGLPLVASLL